MAALAVIAILISLLVPMLGKARRTSQLTISVGNMKQINAANLSFTVDNDNRLVPGDSPKDYTWDDHLSDYLALGMSEEEKEDHQPSDRSSFDVLRCPLDFEGRDGDRAIRTYQVNSMSRSNNRLMFEREDSPQSMKITQLPDPANTVLFNEMVKNNNTVGNSGKAYLAGPAALSWITSGATIQEGTNPNHHKNNYKNPLVFGDGHAEIRYMPGTLANDAYIWYSKYSNLYL